MDRWLAGLRLVVLLGGVLWLVLHVQEHPYDPHEHRQVGLLFMAFTGYSALLYLVNWLRPGRLGLLYRITMLLDLAFVFLLVQRTGGLASDFYLAFYLLIALHAFYFGLRTGVVVAVLASLLLLLSDGWSFPLHLKIHASDLALRIGFFLLVGLCMGGLAERERRERSLVEALNRELRGQQQRLKEAQEQLIRSDRLATVGELAAGLAHDLRNPLAGISGALHVFTGELPREDPRRGLLAEVQGEIERMNRTLNDLLRHARPPALQSWLGNLNEVVEQSLWLLPMASDAQIEVVRQLDPALPPLRLDPALLHQALLNILVNARQAMPNGGRLTVATRLARDPLGKDMVEVAVADTGSGIPEEHRSRIFQPFFTTKAQGTGLGLAIASRIVEQHGGRIAVESEPGRGATFRILLPVAADAAARSQEHAASASRR
jgi:signal transduction histidine kinase